MHYMLNHQIPGEERERETWFDDFQNPKTSGVYLYRMMILERGTSSILIRNDTAGMRNLFPDISSFYFFLEYLFFHNSVIKVFYLILLIKKENL